jgi:hypothetical protein
MSRIGIPTVAESHFPTPRVLEIIEKYVAAKDSRMSSGCSVSNPEFLLHLACTGHRLLSVQPTLDEAENFGEPGTHYRSGNSERCRGPNYPNRLSYTYDLPIIPTSLHICRAATVYGDIVVWRTVGSTAFRNRKFSRASGARFPSQFRQTAQWQQAAAFKREVVQRKSIA